MKYKCDKCSNPAMIHLTEIIDGNKIEKHLCQECAAAEGITVKADIPISKLLEDFILQTPSVEEVEQQEIQCEICGMTFSQFRDGGVLGCPNDYDQFEKHLLPMIRRAHEGASQHTGKVPHSANETQKRQAALLRLRTQLQAAVAREDYERAAVLRDQIKELEQS